MSDSTFNDAVNGAKLVGYLEAMREVSDMIFDAQNEPIHPLDLLKRCEAYSKKLGIPLPPAIQEMLNEMQKLRRP